MSSITCISGSLRQASFNTGLLRAAQELFPDQIETADISAIPLYNADLEAAQGVPAPVETAKDLIADTSGLLIATPEYNNAIPGVLKNALDWLSRPPADIARVFHGRPVAFIGASPGGFGTILAQNSLLPILRTLRTRPWLEGRLMVSKSGDLFDADGNLTDEMMRGRLKQFVQGFLDFADA